MTPVALSRCGVIGSGDKASTSIPIIRLAASYITEGIAGEVEVAGELGVQRCPGE